MPSGASLDAEYDYPGTFTIWLTTKTETTVESIEALLAEVDALVAAPPTEEEMVRSKESMLNSFIFKFETKAEILARQLELQIGAVTLEEVNVNGQVDEARFARPDSGSSGERTGRK